MIYAVKLSVPPKATLPRPRPEAVSKPWKDRLCRRCPHLVQAWPLCAVLLLAAWRLINPLARRDVVAGRGDVGEQLGAEGSSPLLRCAINRSISTIVAQCRG
jgi:hypothetical protein